MKLEELRKLRENVKNELNLRGGDKRIKVIIGMGTSGIAAGARDTLKAFLDEIEKRGLKDVLITQTGEKGLASHEPVVEIQETGKSIVIYGNIDSTKARRIVAEHIVNGSPVSEWVLETK